MDFEKDILLQNVANHLILHSNNLSDIGLFHGKMGVVLFFAHYARHTGMAIYDDFASALVDEICDNIPETLPVNLESGLCGIGWGIQYLISNGFMEGDPDEILLDIDEKIMERNLLRIKDRSLATGLMGISSYINIRINHKRPISTYKIFDKEYLFDWYFTCRSIEVLSDKQILLQIIGTYPEEMDIHSKSLGLNAGYSGYGLKWILEKCQLILVGFILLNNLNLLQ